MLGPRCAIVVGYENLARRGKHPSGRRIDHLGIRSIFRSQRDGIDGVVAGIESRGAGNANRSPGGAVIRAFIHVVGAQQQMAAVGGIDDKRGG